VCGLLHQITTHKDWVSREKVNEASLVCAKEADDDNSIDHNDSSSRNTITATKKNKEEHDDFVS
jgi:hypothetical protein